MARTTDEATVEFTRTFDSFAALSAEFGIEPGDDTDEGSPVSGDETVPPEPPGDRPADADADWAGQADEPPLDPLQRLTALKATAATLAARRERDREDRLAAERERQEYDAILAEIARLDGEREEARRVREGFAAALAKPFGDPEWIYDEGLRDDYGRAIAEAAATEATLAAAIEERRREAGRLAERPGVARLLAAEREREEVLRAHEDAAEANRRRLAALASARAERDAGRFQEARRVLGAAANEFPDDPETRSLLHSIEVEEARVKDAEARSKAAEARRLQRVDAAAAKAVVESIDTVLLSADRMHEVTGVSVDVARHRDLANPRFVRGRVPNSFAIIAERRGEWIVDIAVGADPALRPGAVLDPRRAAAARPLRARK